MGSLGLLLHRTAPLAGERGTLGAEGPVGLHCSGSRSVEPPLVVLRKAEQSSSGLSADRVQAISPPRIAPRSIGPTCAAARTNPPAPATTPIRGMPVSRVART